MSFHLSQNTLSSHINQSGDQQNSQSNLSYIYNLQNTIASFSTQNTKDYSSRQYSSPNSHFLQYSNIDRRLSMRSYPDPYRSPNNRYYLPNQELLEIKLNIQKIQKNQVKFAIQQHSILASQKQSYTKIMQQNEKINDKLFWIANQKTVNSQQYTRKYRTQSVRSMPYTEKSPHHHMSQNIDRKKFMGTIINNNLRNKNQVYQKKGSQTFKNQNQLDRNLYNRSQRRNIQSSQKLRINNNQQINNFKLQQQSLQIKEQGYVQNKKNIKSVINKQIKDKQLKKWIDHQIPRKINIGYNEYLLKLLKQLNLRQQRNVIMYCLKIINIFSFSEQYRINKLMIYQMNKQLKQQQIQLIQHVVWDSLMRLCLKKHLIDKYLQNNVFKRINIQSYSKFLLKYGKYCDLYSKFDPVQDKIQQHLLMWEKILQVSSINIIKSEKFQNQILDGISAFYLTQSISYICTNDYIKTSKLILHHCASQFLNKRQAQKIYKVLKQNTYIIPTLGFQSEFRLIQVQMYKLTQLFYDRTRK